MPISNRTFSRIGFYFVVAMLVLSVWKILPYEYSRIFAAQTNTVLGSSDASSSDPTQALIQTMMDTNAQLTTLGIALLGGLGALILQAWGKPGSGRPWAAYLTAFSGSLSLFFGYACHLNLLSLISSLDVLPSQSPAYQVYIFSSHAQFYFMLAGATFLADSAFHEWGQEN